MMSVKDQGEARDSGAPPRRSDSGPLSTSPSGARESRVESRANGGFRAMIRHAALWDLVQLKCETRSRGVVRVASSSGVGHLYFADGRIVHASLGVHAPERAALEILSWSVGSWDACERPWPESYSIDTPWQGLLLQAAQRQDEAAARPGRSARPPAARREVAAPRIALVPTAPKPEESGVSLRPENFDHAVRLDAEGNVLTGHGAVEEQAALAAYVLRLGDLIGELLGIEQVRALDGQLKSGARALVFRDPNGDTVALRPRVGVDLSRLKAQLEL